ncbi:ABC transporter permease [Dactylosporangium sp. CA-139114]|uniref:ABC transporter permease n=1 Tax=Dactylosporangium sp. CA-139114 TaxID=3239931 RepID=UPI003D99209F
MNPGTELRHPDRLPPSALFTDPLAVARRQLLHIARTPQTAVAAVTSPMLFLTLFRYVFGGAIPVPGISYIDYVVPAMMVQNLIFGGFTSAAGLAQDATGGVLDRFRSLPTPRSSVLAGRALADLLVNAVATLLTLATGWLLGFRFHAGALGVLGGLAVLLAVDVALFAVFAAIGLTSRNPETVQALTPPFFLFLFVSSAFIPLAALPGWLQPFARNQPVTVFTDTLRLLVHGRAATAHVVGHDAGHCVLVSLLWCAVLTVAGGAAALRAYRRL